MTKWKIVKATAPPKRELVGAEVSYIHTGYEEQTEIYVDESARTIRIFNEDWKTRGSNHDIVNSIAKIRPEWAVPGWKYDVGWSNGYLMSYFEFEDTPEGIYTVCSRPCKLTYVDGVVHEVLGRWSGLRGDTRICVTDRYPNDDMMWFRRDANRSKGVLGLLELSDHSDSDSNE